MPTYVYRCDSCNHQFELFQRMSDDPIDTCPECQSPVRRVIHPVGIVFKGSGWYINDSRPKDSATDTPASSDGGKDTSKSDTEKTPDTAKTESSKTESSKPTSSNSETAKPAAD